MEIKGPLKTKRLPVSTPRFMDNLKLFHSSYVDLPFPIHGPMDPPSGPGPSYPLEPVPSNRDVTASPLPGRGTMNYIS